MSHQITLRTLSKATKQRVFNQAAKHLLVQGRKCMSGGFCSYLNSSGLKCVGGCFISATQHKNKIGNQLNQQSWWMLVSKKVAPKKHQELIGDLQQIHDSNPPSKWPKLLIALAEKNKFNHVIVNKYNPKNKKSLKKGK